MPKTPELPSARAEAELRTRLAGDEWLPGEALPGLRALAASLGVSRGTVATVLKKLEAEGLVRIVPGWGTFKAATFDEFVRGLHPPDNTR